MLAPVRASAGNLCLRVLGGVCSAAGGLAWVVLGWKAVEGIDRVTPQGEEGGRLMVWAVTGTLLMIGGMVLLHVASAAEEDRSSG